MTFPAEPTDRPSHQSAAGTRRQRPLTILLLAAPLVALTVVFCNAYLDTQIAILVKRLSRQHRGVFAFLADIPDTLLAFVLVVTVFALFGYFSRARKGINDQKTLLFKLLAWLASASYIVKVVCKYIFGRIETRKWLLRPDLYGFRWFHGRGYFDGFPSGHMLVFTALAAVLWRFYPRYKAIILSFIVLLAFALIAGNYHFLSDVIAGTYLGVLTEMVIFRIIAGRSGPIRPVDSAPGEPRPAGKD